MKELENINCNKFYTQFVIDGHLIEEIVEGVSHENNWVTFYGFEDAAEEAEYEEVTLNKYGNATYFFEGKVYEAIVFLENSECTSVKEFENEEIKALIDKLKNEAFELGYSEVEFIQKEPWINQLGITI
jgi:Fe2+ or Zn2+ uptake regulation protein